MKYLPLRDFEDVTQALNFDTADLHVIGGCDLYTTKAAGRDKKLYKDIENSLQSQYSSVLKIKERLSPDQTESLAASLNLERTSPFGPFTKQSARRTYAYLIATLNASHPDYDFSHVLRPTDFRRERHLRNVTNTIDNTIYNLRPRGAAAATTGFGAGPPGSYLFPPTGHAHRGRRNNQQPTNTAGVLGTQQPVWGPRMWRLIDNEMTLSECDVYTYVPDEDPFDGEEGALWSINYFFFNKNRKRVCYLYFRALSVLSHSPIHGMHTMGVRSESKKRERQSWGNWDSGASKRARYWLGDKLVEGNDLVGGWGVDDDDEIDYIPEPGDDEVDAESEFDVREEASRMVLISDSDSDSDYYETSPPPKESAPNKPRGMSESIADNMEV